MLMGATPPRGGYEVVNSLELDGDDALPCNALQPGVLVQNVHVTFQLGVGYCTHLLFVHFVVLQLHYTTIHLVMLSQSLRAPGL